MGQLAVETKIRTAITQVRGKIGNAQDKTELAQKNPPKKSFGGFIYLNLVKWKLVVVDWRLRCRVANRAANDATDSTQEKQSTHASTTPSESAATNDSASRDVTEVANSTRSSAGCATHAKRLTGEFN
jgi:hypothetical protein